MTGDRPTPWRHRLDPGEVRRTLREHGLRARHSMSQNFLADVEVLEGILAEADPHPGRRVLEVGPGLGILTGGLLDAGAAVTAIELDAGLAAYLRTRYGPALAAAQPVADDPGDGEPGSQPPGSLRLLEANALDVDLPSLVPPPYDVVANLPYHITSPMLHRLLGRAPRADRLVLMLQREVAERVAAPPGAMSYLSVFVQYHAKARVAFRVGRDAFEPAPKVESAVLVLEPYPVDDRLPEEAEDDLWRLVQAAFRERRKMLHNVLPRQLPVPPDRILQALESTAIDPDRRPQTLAVGEWLALAAALGPLPPMR
jgi:16S rRNA (adenine1518-N6/adenine1519-N6)-dimethyltransferase